MKKICSILIVAVMLIGMLPAVAIPAFAEETSGTTGDCTWTLNGTELTISGNGAMGDYDYHENRPWGTAIITKVTIEEGVTHIGDFAFYECFNLVSVSVPASVTSIGSWAFLAATELDRQSNLDSVCIMDITKWCAIEFEDSGSNPLCFADKLYLNGEPITNLVIPDGVTTIPTYAFSCENITSVTIPDSVTSIGDSAFHDCTGLTSITIPDSVTSIGSYAFYGCTGLTSVTILDSVTSIGYSAFEGCTGLTSITIPDSVTSIGSWTFYGCSGLTSITIGDSVTSIGYSAFRDCTSLTSVSIPDSVTSIGDDAFNGCSGLESVYITDISKWCVIEFSVDTILIHPRSNPLYYADNLYLNGELITDLVIPNGVTFIKKNAFYGYDKLTSVTIPDSVTFIGEYAFYGCSGLKEVECQAAVDSIPASAFVGCSNLKRIYLPAEMSLVYSSTFPNTSLQRVFFGGTQAQREAMTIQHTNDGLLNAKWSYNEKGLPDHTYTNACDKDCNECGMTREVDDHSYDDACDNDCNVCKATRTITHAFGGYVYNEDATSQKDGTKTRTCSVCKKTETVTATGTKLVNPFKDVNLKEYYAEPVLWAVGKKITNGMTTDSFAPNNECTRGQIVTFLWRASGSPEPTSTTNPFKDVKSDQYYYKAVLWAVEKGITTGTSANTFSPDAGCTRGQVVTFLHRAKGKPAASGKNAFADVKSGAYYYDAVRWAVKNSITNGMSATSFAPDATCTRGQIVTFLYRAYK